MVLIYLWLHDFGLDYHGHGVERRNSCRDQQGTPGTGCRLAE